jgi:hypothetical protein
MSKVNINQNILTATGEPITENGKSISVKDIIINVLNMVQEGQPPEESYKCGELIVKISRHKSNEDFVMESEEISLVKAKIKKHGLPVTIIQICDILEGYKNPFENNEI